MSKDFQEVRKSRQILISRQNSVWLKIVVWVQTFRRRPFVDCTFAQLLPPWTYVTFLRLDLKTKTKIETEVLIAICWFSERVSNSWQIERLESWHWGLVRDSQRVTWTAFVILAMFTLSFFTFTFLLHFVQFIILVNLHYCCFLVALNQVLISHCSLFQTASPQTYFQAVDILLIETAVSSRLS